MRAAILEGLRAGLSVQDAVVNIVGRFADATELEWDRAIATALCRGIR